MNAVSQQMKQAFADFDVNGDGTLDYTEVTSLVKGIFAKSNGSIFAREPAQTEIEHIFKVLDADGGGHVTLDEFVQVPSSMLRAVFSYLLNITLLPWRGSVYIVEHMVDGGYFLLETLRWCFSHIVSSFIFLGKGLLFRIMLPLAGFCFAVQLLVVVVHGILFLSCDLVEMLVWFCIPKRWQVGSSHWNVACLSIWLLVLAIASPLLFELLKQPLVILWSQAGLAVLVHRQIVQGDVEDISGGLLSTKLYKRFRRQRHLSALRMGNDNRKSLLTGITFGGFLTCYVLTRVDVLVQTPLRSVVMSMYLLNRMINIARSPELDNPIAFWKLLGTVSPMPVHLTDDECEEHDECAVCLSKLCISVGALSLVAAARQRCRPALSACRLRPRGSCAGLSAMRTGGLEFCKETLSGMWGRMMTLPCGHRFHAGCMDSVAIIKLQCPTCRGTLGDDWLDVQPEQKLLYKLGLGAIFAFYCMVYMWHLWLMRHSILGGQLAQADFLPANTTDNGARHAEI